MDINKEAEQLLESIRSEVSYYIKIELILQSFERISKDVYIEGRRPYTELEKSIAYQNFKDYWKLLTDNK